jgi:AraC-like DNA-binding protein
MRGPREQIQAELDRFRETHPCSVQEATWHVRALLNRIHEEAFDPTLNVRTVRARCRIGDHNISCRFKYEVGTSIKDYIENLRLDAARALLQNGAFSAAEVAQGVGYGNLQTFYRAFVRRFRCTPGELRRAAHRAPTSSAGGATA